MTRQEAIKFLNSLPDTEGRLWAQGKCEDCETETVIKDFRLVFIKPTGGQSNGMDTQRPTSKTQ
jgi:hypothetical protein